MTAFLFDLDGTLADTIPGIIHCSRLALDELGHTHITEHQVRALIGIPIMQSAERLVGAEQAKLYFDAYQKHFYSGSLPHLSAFAGIDKLLHSLQQSEAKLAVGTSKRAVAAQQTLQQTGLDAYFSVVVSVESCVQHKPEAEPALTALRLLKAEDEATVMIGDSVFDIRCGNNAGIDTCGVCWGTETADNLQASGAKHIAYNVDELKAILFAYL